MHYSMDQADVDLKVIEYLSKKGYSKTEAMLRIESATQDVEGRPINPKAEETQGVKYLRAFGEHGHDNVIRGHAKHGQS